MINLLLLMFFYYSACAFFSDVMEKEEGSVVRIFEQPSNNKKKMTVCWRQGLGVGEPLVGEPPSLTYRWSASILSCQ